MPKVGNKLSLQLIWLNEAAIIKVVITRYVGNGETNESGLNGKSKRKFGDIYQRRKASDNSYVGMGDWTTTKWWDNKYRVYSWLYN